MSVLFVMSLWLWLGLLLAAFQLTRQLGNRKTGEFALASLFFVAWMGLFSFLSGFSIGWVTAILNVLLAALLGGLVTSYRPQIFYTGFLSLLLVLFMRGFFPPARSLLIVLLGAGSIYALYLYFVHRQTAAQPRETLNGLALVTSLFGLSLLLENGGAVLAFASLAGAVIFGIRAKSYRWQLAMVGLGAALWWLNILLPS